MHSLFISRENKIKPRMFYDSLWMFTPGVSTCTEHITHAEVTAQAKWTLDLSKLNSSWVQCYAAKGSSDCRDSCKRGDSTRYHHCKGQTSQHWSPIMISERQSNPSKKYLTQIFFNPYPEKRSNGQYLLGRFHFPLATCGKPRALLLPTLPGRAALSF